MYSLLFVMVTLSGFPLLRALDQKSWPAWGLYAVVTLLMMHTHYYAAFAVVAQALYVLACHRKALLPWLCAQVVIAAGSLAGHLLHHSLPACQPRHSAPLS